MLPLIKTGKATGQILFGRMYSCKYFALKKEPVFDLWPVIIVMDVKGKWFEGLNLHYLPIKERKELYTLLKQFIIDRDGNFFNFREFKRVLFTVQFRLAQVCIKRYRKENMFGVTVRIRDNLWESVLYENRERFFRWQGQNLKSLKSPIIWRESIRKSRGVGR